MSAGISTHVLDVARGRPARGVPVALERAARDGWERVAQETTDADGRVAALAAVDPGRYRLTFDTAAYLGEQAFYPQVAVEFLVAAGEHRYHVPLLLSPYGYSTYRGS